MTTTETSTIAPGQLWNDIEFKGLACRVIAVTRIDSETYISYVHNESACPDCLLADDFLAHYDTPHWPLPEPRVDYRQLWDRDDRGHALYVDPLGFATVEDAERNNATGLPIVKATTTYEFVTAAVTA